jgi:hypothetical protein
MGRVLHSNVTCSDNIHFISKEMRQALVASIKSTRPKLTVLINESTYLSKRSCLVVYLRTSTHNSEPLTFFPDVLELESHKCNAQLETDIWPVSTSDWLPLFKLSKELSVRDAVKCCTEINHLTCFIDKL